MPQGRNMGGNSGSRASTGPVARPGPSGFDPGRKTSPWTFKFYGERRAAYARVARTLELHGFAVGSRQRGAPSGVMFGDYIISKWRNMNEAEREMLHGKIFADHEPVTLWFGAQPPEIDDAIFALHEALASAGEAGTAATVQQGAVHEHATREAGDATSSSPLTTQ